MSPQVHWAAGVYIVLSSLLPPLGMVVIVVAAMVDVVKRPTAVWPWQVGWVAIVLPPLLAMSVGLALFPPRPDVVRVTWLSMMALPFTAMPTTAMLLLLLLAARTLRPGAWQRQGGLVSGAAALALILLPVTSPWGPFHRIGVFWLPYVPFALLGTLGIAWVAVVRGSGDDRMRHARQLTGGWFLACSVWILLAGLALTTLRAQNEGSQHIVGPVALTTLGVALGIVVVLGVERRPSLLPVLVALTPLAMVLPAASILGR
ncbi:MAG: hypothetical protein H6734_18930 [Alphaproteobacteria bacterium]|nr:hypothetical protein [Alphaproteobacteria bacterium]